MRKSVCIRLRSCVASIGMGLSVCMGVVILMWFFITNYMNYNKYFGPVSLKEMGENFLYSIYSTHARSGFDLFAPVLAVLPAATIFCDDYNSGYIKNILMRQGKNQYITDTLICSSVAGGLAILLPSFLVYTFFVFIGMPNLPENVPANSTTFLDQSVFSGVQFWWGGCYMVILLLILAMLFGATWSNIGLCISSFIPNRYVALATPFAIYYAAHIFCYRIDKFIAFSPANMLMPIGAFLPNILFPFAYQFALLMLSIVCFQKVAMRRLYNA